MANLSDTEPGPPSYHEVVAGTPRPAIWPIDEPTLGKLLKWIDAVETFLTREATEKSDWAEYTLQHFVSDPVREAAERIRRIVSQRLHRKYFPWTWDLLKKTLVEAQDQIDNSSFWDSFKDTRRKHKTAFKVVETTLAVTGAACLAPAALIGGLGMIGFSSAGVVGGSLAAAIQSSIGLVEAGSAFAVAQSITTSGAVLAAASGTAVVGGGALAASGLLEVAYDSKVPPSVTWDDGQNFQPKPEVIEELVEFV